MSETYGFERFKIVCSSPSYTLNGRAGSRWELDDSEQIYTEQIALDGSRFFVTKGQYINPKIIIKKCTDTEIVNLLALVGATVAFTPFADNENSAFSCTVVSVTTLFEKGLYWKDSLEIQLKSNGYATIKPKVEPVVIVKVDNTIVMTAGSGAEIWYTHDGNTPTGASPSINYTAPFAYAADTYKAIAKKNGLDSVVTTAIIA